MKLRGLVFAAWMAAAGGCGDSPTEAECNQLLDHIVDLYSHSSAGEQLTPQAKKDLDEQKKAVKAQVGEKFHSECMNTLPREQVRCSLKARTEADLAKCEEG